MREQIRYNRSSSSNNFRNFLPLIIAKARNGVPFRKRLQDYIGLSGFCRFQLRLRSAVHKISLWAICSWFSMGKMSTFRYPLQKYSRFFVSLLNFIQTDEQRGSKSLQQQTAVCIGPNSTAVPLQNFRIDHHRSRYKSCNKVI